MNLFLIEGRGLKIVREPHYPELITLLASDRSLLDTAHPAGPGAVCGSLDPDYPFALHAERWALPREFWALRDQDIPTLDAPVTPEPLCWRFEGLRHLTPAGEALTTPEEFSGCVTPEELDTARELLAQQRVEVAFYPWFEQACVPAIPLQQRMSL